MVDGDLKWEDNTYGKGDYTLGLSNTRERMRDQGVTLVTLGGGDREKRRKKQGGGKQKTTTGPKDVIQYIQIFFIANNRYLSLLINLLQQTKPSTNAAKRCCLVSQFIYATGPAVIQRNTVKEISFILVNLSRSSFNGSNSKLKRHSKKGYLSLSIYLFPQVTPQSNAIRQRDIYSLLSIYLFLHLPVLTDKDRADLAYTPTDSLTDSLFLADAHRNISTDFSFCVPHPQSSDTAKQR